jgi:hypothetical protein
MPTSFEQEIKNLLRGGGNADKTEDDKHSQHYTKLDTKHEKTGMYLDASNDEKLRTVLQADERTKEKKQPLPRTDFTVVTNNGVDFKIDSLFLLQSGLEQSMYDDNVKFAEVMPTDSTFNAAPSYLLYKFDNAYGTDYASNKYYELANLYQKGADVNRLLRVLNIELNDLFFFVILISPILVEPSYDWIAKAKPAYYGKSSFVDSILDAITKEKNRAAAGEIINRRITDIITFMNVVERRSIAATLYEESTPYDFQLLAEKDFQKELIKASSEYTTEMQDLKIVISDVKAALLPLKDSIATTAEPVFLSADPSTLRSNTGITTNRTTIESINEIVIKPVTKAKEALDQLAQMKKELAAKTLEINKLKKALAAPVGKASGSGPVPTSSSTSSTQVSKEDKLQIKKAFELLLPLAVREVFMKFPAYRYGLTIAGKIHLRNEQSVFVTDITDLARLEMENSPTVVTSASMVTSDFVRNLLQRVQTKYISFLKEGGGGGDPVLQQCKLLLTPVMSTVLETCLGEVTKMVSLETNMSIDPDLLLTEEEARMKKFGTTSSSSSIFGGMGANQKRIDSHKRLMDKFTSWVATVYISDNQIQKNIATTQSDKQVQNYARLLAMLELRSALRDMGFSVKVNPYSSSMD